MVTLSFNKLMNIDTEMAPANNKNGSITSKSRTLKSKLLVSVVTIF